MDEMSETWLGKLKFFKKRQIFNHVRSQLFSLLGEIYSENIDVYIREACGGGIKSYDAVVLGNILSVYKPKKMLEVGSYIGLSSRWLLECTKEWSAKLTAVDPNIPHRSFDTPRVIFERFNMKEFGDRLQYHEGFFSREPLDNDLTKLFPDKAKIWAPDNNEQFDLIFIDAGHSYEEVKYDFDLAINYLLPGGVIIFHDTDSWEGVGQLAEEVGAKTFVPWWYKMVKKFLNRRGYYIDGIGLYVKKE